LGQSQSPPPLQDPVRNRQKGCGLRDPPSLWGCCEPMGILPPPPSTPLVTCDSPKHPPWCLHKGGGGV